jgi:ATP-binding cassette subfamily B protein/subfamily B ATP-binding cassette protein MsbA
MSRLWSSRHRYRGFVQEYKSRRLDDSVEAGEAGPAQESRSPRRGKRREYLREYLRWLWPHRYIFGGVFALALLSAGLEMIEPLFLRFIVDQALLHSGLDLGSRLTRLHLAGGIFVGVIILSNLSGALKDYRQRLLNARSCCRSAGRSTSGCCSFPCRGCGI